MDSKKKKKIIFIACSVVGAIILALIFAALMGWFSKDKTPSLTDKDGKPEETFDPSAFPTYHELEEVIGKAVEDIYGDSYYDLVGNLNGTHIKIPGTEISFGHEYVSSNSDVMALTIAALNRNPYAGAEDTIRTLPTGEEIDLSSLVEEYSGISYLVGREDPTKITVRGYCNSDYFEEDVDLMTLYQKFY